MITCRCAGVITFISVFLLRSVKFPDNLLRRFWLFSVFRSHLFRKTQLVCRRSTKSLPTGAILSNNKTGTLNKVCKGGNANLDKLQAVQNFACRILCGAKNNSFAERLALATNQATTLFSFCCSGFQVQDEMCSRVFDI